MRGQAFRRLTCLAAGLLLLICSGGCLWRGQRYNSFTTIIGNFKYDYSRSRIDISKVSWMKKSFRIAHTRMEYDDDLWEKVEALILDSIKAGV